MRAVVVAITAAVVFDLVQTRRTISHPLRMVPEGEHERQILVEKTGNEKMPVSHHVDPDEEGDDIILTHVQKVLLGLESEKSGDEFDKISKRKAYERSWVSYWPNGVVPWEYDRRRPFQLSTTNAKIEEAIAHWEKKTCLRFPRRTTESNYLKIGDGNVCSSNIGKLSSSGGQSVTLAEKGCINLGSILHELGHAIGLEHEQSRSDRDKFVEILWNNVNPQKRDNFIKDLTSVQVEYDLESAMHYTLYAFSANEKPTIRVKNKELDFLPGSRRELTFYDAKLANLIYNCKGDCTDICYNHGYPFKSANGACGCKCPRGLTGDCNTIDPNFSDYPECGGVYNLNTEGEIVKIVSPGYPNNYPLNKKCVYVIRGPQETSKILLNFDDFEVLEDAASKKCVHSLEINANLIGQKGVKYCGHMGQAPQQAHTFLDHKAAEMMLIFDSRGGGSSSKGFSFTARAITNLGKNSNKSKY